MRDLNIDVIIVDGDGFQNLNILKNVQDVKVLIGTGWM